MVGLRSPESVRTSSFLLFTAALLLLFSKASALDFLLNSFASNTNGTNVTLINDARFESSVVRLTNASNQFSFGRAVYPTKLAVVRRQLNATNGTGTIASFSTSFVFSILPQISTSPGFGLCFFLSNTTSPPGAFASQYFGLFANTTVATVAPLVAVKFDAGRNTEFNEPDDNHIGVNLNNIESVEIRSAAYYNASGSLVPIRMRDGGNVRAWIDFDGGNLQINVTIAPANLPRPARPLLSYSDPEIANYLSDEMFIGFSSSTTNWNEAQRILGWSFSDTGALRELSTTNLPVFSNPEPSPSLSPGAIAGISVGAVAAFLAILGCLAFWLLSRRKRLERGKDENEIEEWEMEYWPHRFEYEELTEATGGFSSERLIGSGGFGKVYGGTLPNGAAIAVKCINHDSKQGLREFMAEISSVGRLQHKNLVQMKGWCKKGGMLMLVYDFMPNGSLNRWIFDRPEKVMGWELRRRVLADVAEGLSYLHHGYDQVVVHRDIKSSNILLDQEMRARVGDFGLAKLYGHGEVPNTTRVVGTLGYLAPELANVAAPTAASDVYSFGVVVLEVACGRRPIELGAETEEQVVLVDWVRALYAEGKVAVAGDTRVMAEWKEGEVEGLINLGLACCHPDPLRRPTMREIMAVLVGKVAVTVPGEVLSELAREDNAGVGVGEVVVDGVKH